MFEFDQEIVNALLTDSEEFKQLYREHGDLKSKVRDAEVGVLPLDDLTLGAMKKEKLMTKDRMATLIEQYRREHA